MKMCSKCSELKPEINFYVKDSKSGRLHAQCKDCYRKYRTSHYTKYYSENKQQYRDRANEYRKKLRNEFRENMLIYLQDKQCSICKENDIRTFEFDHIDPTSKKFSISQAARLGYRWNDVLTEIKKCRILCANCHKKHTASQFSWYKQ